MQTIIDTIQALCANIWGGSWYAMVDSGSGPVRTPMPDVTWANSWLGKLCDCIINNPLLLIFVCLGIVGLAVGFFKRLTR